MIHNEVPKLQFMNEITVILVVGVCVSFRSDEIVGFHFVISPLNAIWIIIIRNWCKRWIIFWQNKNKHFIVFSFFGSGRTFQSHWEWVKLNNLNMKNYYLRLFYIFFFLLFPGLISILWEPLCWTVIAFVALLTQYIANYLRREWFLFVFFFHWNTVENCFHFESSVVLTLFPPSFWIEWILFFCFASNAWFVTLLSVQWVPRARSMHWRFYGVSHT